MRVVSGLGVKTVATEHMVIVGRLFLGMSGVICRHGA